MLRTITKKTNLMRHCFSSTDANLYEEGTKLCKLSYLGDLEQIRHFVETKVTYHMKGYDVNSYDADYRTALHLAAASGHANIVEYLIQKGAKMSMDTFGNIPIHDAKRIENREILNMLDSVELKLPTTIDNKIQTDLIT